MRGVLTTVAVLAVLLVAAQAYAYDIPDLPRWMPEPPRMPIPEPPWPPPIREPPVIPPRAVQLVELMGYIEAVVIDPVDPMRHPGRTEYYFATVDGQRYRLEWRGAKLYLCGFFIEYVGTGRLVIVKGYLRPGLIAPLHGDRDYRPPYMHYVLVAIEIRDPAYPRCR
ncbi:MAG: hypothetical protein ACO2PN_13555 [Pyrobaculum sp.]